MIALKDSQVCLIVRLLEHYKEYFDTKVKLKGQANCNGFDSVNEYNSLLIEQAEISEAIKSLKEAYRD